jgi:glucose 1-dehydrogenase
MTLEGKVALVTGSSQVIGQGIVLRLAQEGTDVVINYRSHPESAEETLKQVQAIGGKCYMAECPNSCGYTIQTDLGSVEMVREEMVRELITESIEHFGRWIF